MRTQTIGWMLVAVLALVVSALLAETAVTFLSAQQSRTGALLIAVYGAVVLWWHVRPLLSNTAARLAVLARRTRTAPHA